MLGGSDGLVAGHVPRPGAPRILVIEDDGGVRTLLVHALSTEYQVESAADGVQGVAAARALRPDLIVTDIKMPRLSGVDLVREIRADSRLDTTSILVLSGHGDDEVRFRLLSEGAQDYIAKPFAVAELRARVRNLVAAQRSRAVVLEREAAREAAIFEVALDGIVSMDHRGVITGFNPAAEAIFGYSRAEAIGRPLAEVMIPPPLREAHQRGLAQYAATGEGRMVGGRLELTGMRKDGTEFPVEVSICRIPASDPPAFTGFLRDLTETKRSAEAVRSAEARVAAAEAKWKAEQRFRRLLESAPDAMIIVDARGLIVEVNAQTENLFGYARDELVGHDVEALLPKRARGRHRIEREEYLRDPKSRPMGSGLELRAVRKDGREIPIEASLSPIDMDDGLVVAAAIRDVSDRRRAAKIERDLLREQAARVAAEEAVRIRDDFVAIAGHELKTPLAALLLQIQVLRRTMLKGEPLNLEERVDKIARSGVRLERLVEQLLDVSRITSGRLRLEPAPFDLSELASQVADRFVDVSAHANCTVTVHAEGPIEGVWDRMRLDTVLTNLLSNAIKFGPGKPIEIFVAKDHGQAVIQVRDHGIGIDPEDREKVFQRFERAIAARDYGGFGLGLWICRNIVEASGGTIDVESKRDYGSTFTVLLPLGSDEGVRVAP
jgi:PAS domain S-box-containing protein